jgi:hypothetical protein
VALAPRAGAPHEVVLRFDLNGYPEQPPTAQPWDALTDQPLPDDLWPTGGQASEVFNPGWNRSALYLPCDRAALVGHEGWIDQHAPYAWHPGRDITHYLRIVRDVLHRSDYQGVSRKAA